MNLTLLNPAYLPHYGFRGIHNIAALLRQAMENQGLPRSTLFEGCFTETKQTDQTRAPRTTPTDACLDPYLRCALVALPKRR